MHTRAVKSEDVVNLDTSFNMGVKLEVRRKTINRSRSYAGRFKVSTKIDPFHQINP